MAFNLADLLELVCETVPDRVAIDGYAGRLSFDELETRANRLAGALAHRGVGPGDRVALALGNRPAYLEAMLAAFKLRAIPVNVNRHYVVDELRYVLNDADPVLVLGEPELADALHQATDGARDLVLAGADYEALLDGQPAARPAVERSGDDGFLLYTGGSAGRPKGVLWRHEDLFFAALGGGNLGGAAIETPEQLVRHLAPEPARTVVASPLMHGTAQWAALAILLAGSTVLLAGDVGFDPAAVLELTAAQRAAHLVLVGDAFALPLADLLDAEPERWQLDSLMVVASGGAGMSDAVAQRLLHHLPGAVVVDGYGASETGGQGRRVIVPGARATGPPRFALGPDSAVLDESLQPVHPGSPLVGRLARKNHIPLGYRNDPQRTVATFPVVNGVRWAVTTDVGRLEEDGTVTLLGRSERVINSGGEKVYPAEVEAAVRSHPLVWDAVVVGVPDARFGEVVAAVVRLRGGATLSLERLRRHCRGQLARFKLPRRLVIVDELPRLPTGKVDVLRATELLADA
ncbi:MAG: 3-oxocholest-4-en-26-oate---CoA ligase [Acidimicrobiia bacterium]|jgi:fatty-acyl-CoA synthase|nr:3-oxocholest-4-en-26-oate---CoA ligase [Acidimicrobiia bacterium]